MKTPHLTQVVQSLRVNPALLRFSGQATAVLRNLAMKPFTPARRSREFATGRELPSLHGARCQIFREKGNGTLPTIVIAGFVPDATEVVEFQRPLLRSFGSIYYLNYPRTGFSTPLFQAQLADLVEDLNRRGQRPVLFAVSFGAGLACGFLREALPREGLAIRGIVLVSPVLCTDDLVRPEEVRSGGVRMLESSLRRILQSRDGCAADRERQIERARRCFQGLFVAGAANRPLSARHLAIRSRIMAVLAETPAVGGFERVLALQEFQKPEPDRVIFGGPVLTLLAEREEDQLVASSPTLALFRDPRRLATVFPRGSCRQVRTADPADPVGHASLIFHHRQYNPLLAAWYRRHLAPHLLAAV